MARNRGVKIAGKSFKTKLGAKTAQSPEEKALQEHTEETILKSAEDDPLCQPTDALFWKNARFDGRWSKLRITTRDVRVQDKELYASLGNAASQDGVAKLVYVAYTKFTDPLTKQLVVHIEAARHATSIERIVWMTHAKK